MVVGHGGKKTERQANSAPRGGWSERKLFLTTMVSFESPSLQPSFTINIQTASKQAQNKTDNGSAARLQRL